MPSGEIPNVGNRLRGPYYQAIERQFRKHRKSFDENTGNTIVNVDNPRP